MRRKGFIFALVLVILFLQTAVCFAQPLKLVNSYPHNGGKGFQPVNLAVKLYFNQDVSSEEIRKANSECLQIVDSKGKVQPPRVLYDPKDKDFLMVVLEKQLKEDAEYKLTISENFMSSSQEFLGKPETINFRTRNTANDMKGSMIMMGVMFVGILFFSSRQMKHQLKKEAAEKGREDKVNPYKMAKETGKSVTEIVEKTEKARRKKAAEGAKRQAKMGAEQKEAQQTESGNKRVKRPRPISAGGSAYVSGRKAKAEEEAARIEATRRAGTTRPKNQSKKKKKKT